MFGPSLCRNGRCLNTVPGYTCLCNPGYHYNAVHRKCEGEDASPPSPPHPTPVHSPSPCQPAPSWLGVPTAAGGPEVRGAVGLSGLVCEHLWERHPWGGASQAGLDQGRRGKQGATSLLSVTSKPSTKMVQGQAALVLPHTFLLSFCHHRSRRVPGHGL